MKARHMGLILLLVTMSSGCYAEMTGTVVDAETGAPIEGAVVLVEWTITKGVPGMTVTESYKVIEAATDYEGKVRISGAFNPLVNPPHLTIYKRGYVVWNNEFIFPGYKKRNDFDWKNSIEFKLEIFKPEYGYDAHISFIHSAIRLGFSEKKLMIDAIDWETYKASDERRRKGKI